MSRDHHERLKRIQDLCSDVSNTINKSQQQRKSALELAQEAEKLAEACENEQQKAESKARKKA